MYEVELKFRDVNGDFVRFLKKQECLSEKSMIDEYFDIEGAYSLFLKGAFIRIRTKDDKKKIDFKFDAEDVCNDKHEYCTEKSFVLPIDGDKSVAFGKVVNLLGLQSEQHSDFFELNNLKPFVTITKTRRSYKMDEFSIDWDAVEELGEFIEIEILEEDKEKLEQRIREIKEFVKDFNMSIVSTGYVELFLKENNLELYEQGRFKE
jgi:adenylate cyclase class IV